MFCSPVSITDIRECPLPLFRRLLATTVLMVAGTLALAGTATATPALGTITSIAPSSGPVAGDTTVTILGTDLYYGTSGPAVTIGGNPAPVTSWRRYGAVGETEVIVTTPAGTAGAADVRVVTAEAGYGDILLGERTGGFTYVAPEPPFAVTGVSPASGLSTGGEPITITGKGFSGGSVPSVTLGGTAATDVAVVNDTTITAMTPSHAAGSVGVSVTHDGIEATRASAYTFNQGYWLTVTTQRPADIGNLTSPGAMRTPASGAWATTTTTEVDNHGIRQKDTTHSGYFGGINCGQRSTFLDDTAGLVSTRTWTTETWEASACRYAFAAGSNVSLSALTSSFRKNWLLNGLPWLTQMGFLGAWGGDCPVSTPGGSCSIAMTADRTVRAAWGYVSLGFLNLVADVVAPVFAADGSMQFYKASGVMSAPPTVIGGLPSYLFYAYLPVSTATSRQRATATQTGPATCRTSAHVSGRRMQATCAVTPALARALAKGSVRLTTRWYVRLPHQSNRVLIRQGRITLRGRRTSAITG